MITSTYRVSLDGTGPVDVTVSEYGEGRPFLLLHGGGGPDTVARFGETLAAAEHVRVLVPIHPGFGGTLRPEALHSVRDLAALYVALLDHLGLDDVTVIGNSLGGWIARRDRHPELTPGQPGHPHRRCRPAGPGPPRRRLLLPDHGPGLRAQLPQPRPFRIDPATLPPAAQAIAAGNRAALAAYAGTAMTDPSLGERLHDVAVPTLVVWGDSDRIADPEYGRAFAAAIPKARFELLKDTGHMPQVETPGLLLEAIR